MCRLIKLAEHIFLNSQYNLLAIHEEIEADEQPTQGYYPFIRGIGFKIPSYEAVVEYRGRRSIFLRSRRSIIEVVSHHRPRRSI